MTDKTTERLCSVKDAAAQFDVSRRTIKRLIRRGAIKGVRIGRILRIPSSEISRIAKNGTDGEAQR